MDAVKRTINIILILILSVSGMNAQNTYSITGKVQDDKEALVGVNVVLKVNQKIFGVSTDVNGAYKIQVPKGKYNLEISYIGYTKYTAQVEVDGNVTLPIVTLHEDSQLMDEVVVTARTITYNAGGYVSEISKNPFYREQDMNSILKLSPGTNTTANSISVYGQNVSKVYLNGRELKLSGEQLINYLGTLEGKNIKQMEVVAASGADEDANIMGSSIIRITTINPETGGMLNIGGMSILYGDEGKYSHSPNVMLNWRINKKWATYFNGTAVFMKNPSGNHTETHFYDTDVRVVNGLEGTQRLKGRYRGLWGISYDLDANNLFSLEASYVNANNNSISHDITRRFVDGTYQTTAEGNIDARNKNWETNLSFMYTHKFNSNAELNVQADRLERNTKATNNNCYSYLVGDIASEKALSDENHLLYTARLDYVQRFKRGNGTLKMGVKYTNISDNQDTDYIYFLNDQRDDETSYLDLYHYSEEVYAAYAKYSFKVKKFDVTAGLRMEHALLSPRSSANPERNKDSKHTNWAPELGINYALNKEKGHNIAFQYNRSISRPFFIFLNPMVKRVNEYSYSMGNPLLEPSSTNRFSLRTTFFNGYTLSLTHTNTNDGIISLPENVNGVLYTTPQKGLKRSDYSAYVGIPLKLKQWGQLDLYVQYDYSKESYNKENNSNGRWLYGFSALFQLPADINVNVDFSEGTPLKSLYGKIDSNPMGDVRISKSFLKRSLNVSLKFADVFNSFGSVKNEYFYTNHSSKSESTYHSFNLGVNLRYTFRWGQKSMVRRGGSGNMEETIRLGD